MADPSMALNWEGLEKLQAEKKEIGQEHEANLAEWENLATSLGKDSDNGESGASA